MILLDTHVAIWMANEDKSLGKQCLATLDQARKENELAISAITFWEIALLIAKGRLAHSISAHDLRRELLGTGVKEIALTGEIGILAASLNLHGDPADRFIVATALTHGATLMTADSALLKWRNPLPRQNATR